MKTFVILSVLILFGFIVSDLVNIIPDKPTELIVEDNQIKSTKMDSSISIPKNIVDSSDTKSLVKDSKKEETLNLSMLFQKLMKSYQKFSISPNSDTILKCKEGTILSISSNSFAFENSDAPISKNIDLQIKEFYKPSDFIEANLTTKTKDEILETGGTIFIEAYSEGKKCKLKIDQTIEIRFPYKDKKDGMELFTGRWTENNNIVWEKEKPIDKTIHNSFVIENKPEFPGGQVAMFKYITENMVYPAISKENGNQGIVYIQFKIDTNGAVINPQIIRGVDPNIDKEALRVVKSMPKFIPGNKNGKKVIADFIIPLRFSLIDGNNFNVTNEFLISQKNIKQTEENFETASSTEINSYILYSTNLGWINCDRFGRSTKQKINYFVKSDEDVNVKIVFNDFRSILPGAYNSKGTIFQNVPNGEKITIIALKCENNSPYIAIKQTVTSEVPEYDLVFEKVTLVSLKEKIKILNAI